MLVGYRITNIVCGAYTKRFLKSRSIDTLDVLHFVEPLAVLLSTLVDAELEEARTPAAKQLGSVSCNGRWAAWIA